MFLIIYTYYDLDQADTYFNYRIFNDEDALLDCYYEYSQSDVFDVKEIFVIKDDYMRLFGLS